MPQQKDNEQMSPEEYLEGELVSEIKHEFIDGHVYAMAGTSKNHERICQNLSQAFGVHLKGSPCEPFSSEIKVKVGINFFYPDVLIDCDTDESDSYVTDSPVLIVEVLSKSTRRTDKTTKSVSYMNIPSLKEYVLIEQDFVDIEVLRRKDGWVPHHYFLGDEVTFESIDLNMPVEEVYERVKNQDMTEFLAKKG